MNEYIILEVQTGERICTFKADTALEAKVRFSQFHTKDSKERGGINIKMKLYCEVGY